MVKKGDFLAQIDPRPYQAALAQAQGQLAKDQALLAQAQSDLARYETLNKQDSIAKQQVTDQEALVAQDKAAIVTDQAQVQTAAAQSRLYPYRLADHRPRRPQAGRSWQLSAALRRDTASSSSPRWTRSASSSRRQRTTCRASPRGSIRAPSCAVTVFDRANVNELATGTLTTYDSQVDVTTGTIKMRATFDNPKGVLFPQQFVNVRLLVDTLTGVALAPNAAIQVGPSGNFVYLLNAGLDRLQARRRQSGRPTAHVTTITSGLAPGDKVVIDGVDRLRDGAKVRVVEAGGRAGRGRAAKPADREAATAPASCIARATARRRRADPAGRRIGPPAPTRRRRRSERCALEPARVNPSRIFIDRPVATSLLMIAILLVGLAAYRFLPLSALPEVDYPTIQVQTFYPGASPEVMTSAVTAPLERQFGQMPSLSQMMSQSSAGASVITLRFGLDIGARHRRAGGAGRDQRRRQSSALRPAGAADLRQGQSGRRANPDARRRVGHDEADRGRGPHREPACAETVAASGRRAGVDLGRPAAGRAHPRQSAGARGLWRQSRRSAHDHQQSQRQHAEGQFRRAGAGLDDQRQRPDPRSRRTI